MSKEYELRVFPHYRTDDLENRLRKVTHMLNHASDAYAQILQDKSGCIDNRFLARALREEYPDRITENCKSYETRWEDKNGNMREILLDFWKNLAVARRELIAEIALMESKYGTSPWYFTVQFRCVYEIVYLGSPKTSRYEVYSKCLTEEEANEAFSELQEDLKKGAVASMELDTGYREGKVIVCC